VEIRNTHEFVQGIPFSNLDDGLQGRRDAPFVTIQHRTRA
jgi:hypothetical protein